MYKCENCAREFPNYRWECPNCKRRDTVKEIREAKTPEELEFQKKEKAYRTKLNNITSSELLNHLYTTGYSFEDYHITKYCGIVVAQVIMGTGFLSDFSASFSDFFGVESNSYAATMREARESAMQQITKESIAHGGNAIIGIDFDYTVFAGNMIGVSVSGTSVFIRPVE